MRAVSACLLGLACRYDGAVLPACKTLPDADLDYIPLCPEQLGGLPTPRAEAQISGGDGADVLDGNARVITRQGDDVTAQFIRGAEEVLRLCRKLGINEVLLKSRSPSCGVGEIYHGAVLVDGDGVTVALLRRNGLQVLCHQD